MNLFFGNEIPRHARPLIAEMVAAWSSDHDPKIRGALLSRTPDQIHAQIDAGRAITVITEIDGDLIVVGYAHFMELHPGVWEFGTVIVNPRHRGMGLAHLLYKGMERLHPILGGTVWETTHADAVVHLSVAHGFTAASYDEVDDPTAYQGLCREAPCFIPDPARPERCKDEHNRGGGCKLCVRRLVAEACNSAAAK